VEVTTAGGSTRH